MWAWSFDRKKDLFCACFVNVDTHTYTREARRANICQSIFHARSQQFRFMCCPILPLSRRRSFHHVKSLVEWVGSEVAQTFDPIRLLFFPPHDGKHKRFIRKNVLSKKLPFPRTGIIFACLVFVRFSANKFLKAIKQHNILLYFWSLAQIYFKLVGKYVFECRIIHYNGDSSLIFEMSTRLL